MCLFSIYTEHVNMWTESLFWHVDIPQSTCCACSCTRGSGIGLIYGTLCECILGSFFLCWHTAAPMAQAMAHWAFLLSDLSLQSGIPRGTLQWVEFVSQRRSRYCRILQGVAGCCGVLQRVAIGCSRLQACCSVVAGITGSCRVLQMTQGVAGCCRVLQGVAGCCRVLQSCCSHVVASQRVSNSGGL